ncbi:hypothetical protein AB7M11_008072 [Bradyrhizobium ottawaense]
MTTPVALTIAGSDSSGGAGIQADLKTFAALGVYGASAITALTAQNTRGVTGIHPVPAEFVTVQIDAVFSDLDIGAVKIGMVAEVAGIDAVAAALSRWSPRHVVLDPVMVATSGDRLLASEAVDALRTKLISLASVITPNLPEAAALLDAAGRGKRGRDRKPGASPAGARLPCGPDQGRTRRGRREHRLSRRCPKHDRARRAARCDPQHPWHRLLAVLGGRGWTGQGRRSGACRAQRQVLDQRGHRSRRPLQRRARPRPGPSFPQVLLRRAVRASAAIDPLSAGFIVPNALWLHRASGSPSRRPLRGLVRMRLNCVGPL